MTIRNSKKVNYKDIFNIVIDSEIICKAKCWGVLEIETQDFLNDLFNDIGDEIMISLKKTFITIRHTKYLGFRTRKGAYDTYKDYLNKKSVICIFLKEL